MTRNLLLAFVLFSCSAPYKHDHSNENSSIIIKTKIIRSEYGGFGYDIEVDGKLLIHQPNVPVSTGYKGFNTEQEAQQVADWVVRKLKNNQIPPTVTSSEVDSLIQYTIAKD